MQIHKQFGMSYKLMSRLIEMVERGEINEDHAIFNGQYERMKRQLIKESKGG